MTCIIEHSKHHHHLPILSKHIEEILYVLRHFLPTSLNTTQCTVQKNITLSKFVYPLQLSNKLIQNILKYGYNETCLYNHIARDDAYLQ